MKNTACASVARNLLRHIGYETGPVTVIADDGFYEIASCICGLHIESKLILLSSYSADNCGGALRAITVKPAILLATPETYAAYRLFLHLDFSRGEPKIPGIESKILIFPTDSIVRIFSVDPECHTAEKNRLLSVLLADSKYRITTPLGTDLVFRARTWLPLDFEVCTAPLEDSVSGEIVIDGALFFKKTDSKLRFIIERGKLTKMTAFDQAGEADLREYIAMTKNDMEDPVNCQLAEIGIGFCGGAEITDCFMEAEAVKGTCHFCFGNNICYGGNNASEFHGASVLIKDPNFELIG